MSYTFIDRQAFTVCGIAIRTTNHEAEETISQAWYRFFSEGIFSQIPKVQEDAFYGVYTEYESDENGAYTFLIGMKVPAETVAPEGMRVIHIPAGQFAHHPAKGKGSEAVMAAWEEIWQRPYPRAYKVDYERYDPRYHPDAEGEMDVYISLPS